MTTSYKSYMFRTKDPVIDQLRTMVQREKGSLDRKALRQVHESSTVSTAAMRGWFFGKTRRPQSATVEAVGRSLGYHRQWVKTKGKP